MIDFLVSLLVTAIEVPFGVSDEVCGCHIK